MKSKPFAEVIESSLTDFTAQSWQWDTFAPFGSLVQVNAGTKKIFAIVYQVQTGSMDPNRTPFVYQKTEQELLAEQPQLFTFLKTTFSCLVLAHQEKGKIEYTISPTPPKIHAFVAPVSTESLKTFFYQDTYLHTLFNAADKICNLDELLLALFKKQKELDILSKPKLHQLIETFSILSGNDYRRLKLFLQRVEPIVQNS